jgi:hypothetical protein
MYIPFGINKPELIGSFEADTLFYEKKSFNRIGRCLLMICSGYLVLRLPKSELNSLTHRISQRVAGFLEREGLLVRDDDNNTRLTK